MTNFSTTPRAPATVSEQQLFSEFLREGITTFSPSGKAKSCLSADQMFDPGFETLEFLPHCLEVLRDQASADESPSIMLEFAEADLMMAAKTIAMMRTHFGEMMSERVVHNDHGDEDRYLAGDPNAQPEAGVEPKAFQK
ncbi:hypothetical protein [Mesorhizobium sp. LjNodule214]|uniref:hypothetical protein n=1 Tax=Mesorhizobium sp. LjNodule214 TaxID=3342252 RepID=UPI003ECE3E81